MRRLILGTIFSVVTLAGCAGEATGVGQPATCVVEPWNGDAWLGCARETTHSLLVCTSAPGFEVETWVDGPDGGALAECVQGHEATVFCCP